MDCGPAVLQCLLRGFGIPAQYGRLREVCQTDVDGTSITTLEEVACDLGLEAEQVLVPEDHLLLPEAGNLPAVVVVVTPTGETHFVVVWRRHGRWLQVMDPASGRHWTTEQRFLRRLYRYTHRFPAADWREWAGSQEFLDPLTARMRALGAAAEPRHQMIETATADPDWGGLAALDAAVRLTESLARSGAVARGRRAADLAAGFFKRAVLEPSDTEAVVPSDFWAVWADPDPPADDAPHLWFRGALLIRAHGRRPSAQPDSARGHLTPEAAAELIRPQPGPWRRLWSFLRGPRQSPGRWIPLAVAGTVAAAAVTVVIEALLLNAFLDLGSRLVLPEARLGALVALLVFVATALGIELLQAEAVLRLGRRLEARLRTAFLTKVPRLGDRYLRSRLRSDMAERCHTGYNLRGWPILVSDFLGALTELAVTVAAIAWLYPNSGLLAALAATMAILLPVAAQPFLAERDLRLRNQTGALSRYYLDALHGHVAVRAHGAERTVRREHAGLLGQWLRAGIDLLRGGLGLSLIQWLTGYAFAAALIFSHLSRHGADAGVLLLTYWALKIPMLGDRIVLDLQRLPYFRSLGLRLLEPLGAPEEEIAADPGSEASAVPDTEAVALELRQVSVRAGGMTILEDIDLTIEAGSHVAVLGLSGAGKSSLVGTLLGWYRPAHGEALADGQPLGGEALDRLRSATVWVDPSVQLWNRPLIDNLRYGASSPVPLGEVLADAQLEELLETLPQGIETSLGEGGGLVSGGEGQRVRFGRGLGRSQARLVILDEPFRGLDSGARRALLERARERWRDATLICVTHDLEVVADFDQAVVLEDGRIRESGAAVDLLRRPESRLGELQAAEEELRGAAWEPSLWRRLRISNGRLHEPASSEAER